MMLQLYLFVLSCASIKEVCSHVGALLFAIEARVKIRNTQTVKEEKAYWMRPQAVNKVEYKRPQDIDFTSAKKVEKARPFNSGPRQRKLPTAPGPTADDLKKLFCNLGNTTARPVILSLGPHFAESYRTQDLSKRFPVVLSNPFNADCVG